MGRRILYNVPLMLSVARFKELARVRAFDARYIAASGICKPGLVWESERERDGGPMGGGVIFIFLVFVRVPRESTLHDGEERKKERDIYAADWLSEREREVGGGGFSDCPGPRSIDCTGFLFLFSFLNGLNGAGHDIITPLTHRPHPYSST